jgi:hypothetical protein
MKKEYKLIKETKTYQTWQCDKKVFDIPTELSETIYKLGFNLGKYNGLEKGLYLVDESLLSHILEHFYRRGVGNTTAEVEGVANVKNAKLIVHNENFNTGLPREKQISINSCEKLRGTNFPIVIDHFALQEMLHKITKSFIDLLEYKTEPYENNRN